MIEVYIDGSICLFWLFLSQQNIAIDIITIKL